jgi:hypothetical protein
MLATTRQLKPAWNTRWVIIARMRSSGVAAISALGLAGYSAISASSAASPPFRLEAIS